MKILCIDIGNSSTHYGLVEGQSVERLGEISTTLLSEQFTSSFQQHFAELLPLASGVAFCSVVPSVNTLILGQLQQSGQTLFHLTHQNCKGLTLVYPNPAEIGQDRLANALAAQAFYGAPVIVIDMGTAVTFDIISRRGYEGGIIAPGLQVMTNYLHEQTALLPKLLPEDLISAGGAIGKTTVHAMQLGVTVGFSGMIDALTVRVTEELKAQENMDPIILSTGGSIANLHKEWSSKSQFVETLTLQGLAVGFNHAYREQ
jgi:type III pantothenate kinase